VANDAHFRKLERMYLGAPINQWYRPALSISEGSAEVSIAVRPEFFHAANAVHGSVYFKLLDDSAFFAANSLVEDVFVLTTSFNVYLTRPVTSGRMVARGRVVHRSARVILAESEVFDDAGRVVGRGSGAFMPGRTALTEEIGYR